MLPSLKNLDVSILKQRHCLQNITVPLAVKERQKLQSAKLKVNKLKKLEKLTNQDSFLLLHLHQQKAFFVLAEEQ